MKNGVKNVEQSSYLRASVFICVKIVFLPLWSGVSSGVKAPRKSG